YRTVLDPVSRKIYLLVGLENTVNQSSIYRSGGWFPAWCTVVMWHKLPRCVGWVERLSFTQRILHTRVKIDPPRSGHSSFFRSSTPGGKSSLPISKSTFNSDTEVDKAQLLAVQQSIDTMGN